MTARRVMVPDLILELVCECGRTQPMYIAEDDRGGPKAEDLEECGWTFEPDRCPFCNDPTLIDSRPLLN